MERKIAFCVSSWAADSTLYSWTYTKQYFLRKARDEQGTRCSVALTSYPYTMIELEQASNIHSTLLDFAEDNSIDIVIVEDHDDAECGSVSGSVKQKSTCPCLVVRPAAARNEKMRIKSQTDLAAYLHNGGDTQLTPALKASLLAARRPPESRRVLLALEVPEARRHMCAWAASRCLLPDDELYLVHLTSKGTQGLQKAVSKRLSLETESGMGSPEPEELSAFKIEDDIQMRGDVKERLCQYAEEQSIDLIVVLTAGAGSKLRKGYNLSSHLQHHAPCPVLAIPIRTLGLPGLQDLMEPMPSDQLDALGEPMPSGTLAPANSGQAPSPFSTVSSPPASGNPQQMRSGSPQQSPMTNLRTPSFGVSHANAGHGPLSPARSSSGHLPSQQPGAGLAAAGPTRSANSLTHALGPQNSAQGGPSLSPGTPMMQHGGLSEGAVPPGPAFRSAMAGNSLDRAVERRSNDRGSQTGPIIQFAEDRPRSMDPDDAGGKAGAGLHSTGNAELSTALDMIARLKRQLAERDREILDLKDKLHVAQLVAVQREASSALPAPVLQMQTGPMLQGDTNVPPFGPAFLPPPNAAPMGPPLGPAQGPVHLGPPLGSSQGPLPMPMSVSN
ncbi:hypothetical protein WJX84_010163 [Apatococcus fuscideae]|uniref:UspA domain-containing protein n=1 Tax=Apatococcus fuscideae TaxID=2026836 RepID=A0AAW1SQA5_9CHLO